MKKLFFITILSFSTISFAQQKKPQPPPKKNPVQLRVHSAKVMRIHTTANGYTYVYVDKAPIGNVPKCATSTKKFHRYIISDRNRGGKSQLTMLLSAAAAGRAIHINGQGVCGVDRTTEMVNSVMIDYGKIVHNK